MIFRRYSFSTSLGLCLLLAILACSACSEVYFTPSEVIPESTIDPTASLQLVVTPTTEIDSSCPAIELARGIPPGLLFSMRMEDQGYLCYFDEQGLQQFSIALPDNEITAAKWSPDKSHIVYLALGPSEVFDLWIARSDGSGQVRVVEQAPYVDFMWLSDPLRLDYSIWEGYYPPERDPSQDQRFVMNLGDSTITQAVNHCHEAYATYATAGGDIPEEEFLGRCRFHLVRWSPDRSRLAIRTYLIEGGEAEFELALVHVPSGHLTQVALPDPMIGLGNWAPDNRWLSMTMKGEIYILDSVTLDLRQLTSPINSSIEGASTPVWSPNGEWLAFTRAETQGGKLCLFVIRRNGKDQRQLACGLLGNNIVWSPDNQTIAFEFRDNTENRVDIYVTPIDGGPMLRLTQCGHRLRIQDWK